MIQEKEQIYRHVVSLEQMIIRTLGMNDNVQTNTFKSMTKKGSNTSLVKKRKNAVEIGLESLRDTWNGKVFPHDEETTLNSRAVLQSLIPSIEKQIAKTKEGSPQKTLIERRLIALKLAIEFLENRLK